MVCNTCGGYTYDYKKGLLGLNVIGRNTPGYDIRYRPAGVPFTDEERMINHYQRYGTTDLPVRGTGLGLVQQKKLDFDLGSLIGGVIIGFIIGGLLLTSTGRQIGYRAGQRIAKKF